MIELERIQLWTSLQYKPLASLYINLISHEIFHFDSHVEELERILKP